MGFPKQEYGSGLPFPSPGYLPDLGIKPTSPALAGGFFITEPPGNPLSQYQNPIHRSGTDLIEVAEMLSEKSETILISIIDV